MKRTSLTRMSRTRVRKRGTSVAKRARFQKPTARNQKRQIMGNALAIRQLKSLMPPPVYTDYQYSAGYAPFFPNAGVYSSILSDKIMNPTQWNPCLRKDPGALASSTTLVKRVQINLRYDLGKSDWCQMTTFIVSLRKDAANRNIFDPSTLVENEDFIVSTQQNQNPRLNPNVFKVHYVRNLSLTSNTWRQPAAEVATSTFAGNPETTFAKGQVNLKLNFKLRQPTPTTNQNWKVMTQDQLSPYQRMFILTFFKGQTAEPDDDPPVVFYDCLYTCYNSG